MRFNFSPISLITIYLNLITKPISWLRPDIFVASRLISSVDSAVPIHCLVVFLLYMNVWIGLSWDKCMTYGTICIEIDIQTTNLLAIIYINKTQSYNFFQGKLNLNCTLKCHSPLLNSKIRDSTKYVMENEKPTKKKHHSGHYILVPKS